MFKPIGGEVCGVIRHKHSPSVAGDDWTAELCSLVYKMGAVQIFLCEDHVISFI